MKKLLFAAVAAGVLASPASAQQWLYNQQLENTMQGMILDQQVNGMAAQAMRNNQAAVNRGLDVLRPQPYGGCNPYNRSLGLC
jgi:opacity protein-like surface antigen